MELPRNHHFKPVFFLSRWTGKDGRLCEMRLIRGKLVVKRPHPEGTGYIKDLYRTDGVPEDISQDLEIKFMSPLDNGAATALSKLAVDAPLSAGERMAWARFLLSMLYRNRECVELIKTHMTEIRSEATLALEPDWATQHGHETTLAEAAAARKPAAADIDASNMLVDIIANSRALPDIARMHWKRIDLRKSTIPLLTSDRPLVFVGLSHPKAHMALPIGPYDLFVAVFDEKITKALLKVDPTKLAWEMNRDVVSSARQFVWGVDDGQIDVVRTWIGSTPDRVILTETQRQNILAIGRGLQPVDPG
jgi:hypothetical protein